MKPISDPRHVAVHQEYYNHLRRQKEKFEDDVRAMTDFQLADRLEQVEAHVYNWDNFVIFEAVRRLRRS